MAGMGPPPKPDAQRRRRNATVAMMRLPAEGRTGEPPAWPLRKQLAGTTDLWAQLWATPQAVAWERLGIATVRIVARYSQVILLAEKGDHFVLSEARQLEDRLGLTPMSMLRLRWEIAVDELAEARAYRAAAEAAPAARRRLQVVDDAAAAV